MLTCGSEDGLDLIVAIIKLNLKDSGLIMEPTPLEVGLCKMLHGISQTTSILYDYAVV